MPKALFNIAYTLAKPPKMLTGEKRAEYMARRNFYNLTADYNYFSYALDGKKVVKNKDAENYFTRGGTNSGLFDTNGALSSEQVAELKRNIAKTESNIWHGFISFDEETSTGFNTQENAVKFLNQTFNAFLDRTTLKRDNVCLYAALHDDTDHRHIHFAFFEKEAKRRNKNGILEYTKKGKFDAKAIDNYLVSANMHLSERADEYYTARNAAMDQLKTSRREFAAGVIRNQPLNRAINKIIDELPKEGRLQYNAPNMRFIRPEIDKAAQMLIALDPKANAAHYEMLKQFARIEQEVVELAQTNKMAYTNGRRMTKDEIEEVMNGKEYADANQIDDYLLGHFGKEATADEIPNEKPQGSATYKPLELKHIDLKNIDYVEKLKADYNARLGNTVIGLCRDIKDGDFRDRKRRAGVNDKGLKIAAKRTRVHRGNVLMKFERMLGEMCCTSNANFVQTVKQNERENEVRTRAL